MKQRFATKQNKSAKSEGFVVSETYKEQVRQHSYIGKKGYTVPKNILDPKDYECLKKELMMKPFSMTSYTTESTEFPVYRENVAKIYLPRFYGIKRYGEPERTELEPGENIDIPFTKELREYQTHIINVYLKYVERGSHGGAILEVPCGRGKCLAKNTPVMMYDGSIQLVQDIGVGDQLMGDDLTPRKVLSLATGYDDMYVVSEKGTNRSYTVNKSHILSLVYNNRVVDISICDYLNHSFKEKFRGFRIPNQEYPLLYEISVSFVEKNEYYGFEIDGNRRFVLGDYTVTHNTVMALNIISQLKKKAIILVHKEFLMNQWIERIAEFMPSARIGKIQGPLFEIEGKDIVLGMIQTLHSRDFSADAFSSFGLTVIDEVHRIGSEEFSKTLFKIVSPYMLGISATVERKDRLTKILYMFIGDKIYSEERRDEDVVNVRAIQFKTADRQFNETEYDFRGSPKYSTMITKLCQFGPRTDFIVRVISDLILENPHKQIMVLAHNRELLTYMYDAIRHKISDDENTVGYYVGGMKEKDLKITEGRRIVLATYAMAAEALDIKTLSTLVMATPKTDIEQSVGRILRAKGQNPIVVDITDTHEYLKRQWNTRRVFYKKCNYRILSIGSDTYSGFQTENGWRVEFDPKTTGTAEEKSKCFIQIPREILDAEEV
jgi:superfamily II DNA or RNA helicase